MSLYLQPGKSAPRFSTTDVFGKTVTLEDYKKKYVLLVFMRYAGCPWCNLAIHRLSLEYKLLLKNGCEVVAFIQSEPSNIKENIYDRHEVRPPFAIIADQERRIYDKYQVKDSKLAIGRSLKKLPYWVQAVRKHGFKQATVDGSVFMVPAMFLVAPDTQEIILAKYSQDFYEHETFTSVYQHLNFKES